MNSYIRVKHGAIEQYTSILLCTWQRDMFVLSLSILSLSLFSKVFSLYLSIRELF